MEINWASIIGVTLAAVTFITGIATGFLSLFIDNKLNKQKDDIINHIDAKFALKETIEAKFDTVHRRLDKLER